MKNIIALDSKYFPMNKLDRKKAIRAIATGRAVILDIKTYEKDTNFNKDFSFIMYPNNSAVRHCNRDKKYSKSVLNRDNHKCTYCGKKANTVDHIVPKAKGGTGKWNNVIAACWHCNQKKADKTLEQANMEMLFVPKSRTQILFEEFQQRINETF